MAGGDHLARADAHRLQRGRARRSARGSPRARTLGRARRRHRSRRGRSSARIRWPPFATAAYAFSSWSGVTAMTFWPMPACATSPVKTPARPCCAGPLGAGDDALLLAGQPDAAQLAEAELVRPLGQRVDRRSGWPSGRRRCPSSSRRRRPCRAARSPAGSSRTGTRPPARRGSGSSRRSATAGPAVVTPSSMRGDAGDELVGRARRVDVADGVVAQRPIRIGQVDVEVLDADARRELVVVVRRQRDHRQDLAGLRVHDDRHALADVGRLHAPRRAPAVARRCISASIVSIRFVPGSRLADRLDHLRAAGRTRRARPAACRSVPRSSSSNDASIPALPMTSSRR